MQISGALHSQYLAAQGKYMNNASTNWDPDKIRETFAIVKTEVTTINRRNKRCIVGCVTIGMLLLSVLVYVFSLHQIESKVITFICCAVTVFIAIAIVFICVQSSEKCITNLHFCEFAIDERQSFLGALSKVSCGGDAIKHFFQFMDKSTNVVNAVQGNQNDANQAGGQ